MTSDIDLIWLFLSIILDFGFVQFFKLGERRGHYGPVVVVANYLTVAICVGAYLLATAQWSFSESATETGFLTGVLFISALLTMNYALTLAPVGPVLSAFRMAIVIPVFFGVYLWNEPVLPTQMLGLLLALSALVLMTPRGEKEPAILSSGQGPRIEGLPLSRSTQGRRMSGLSALTLLTAVFLLQGLSHTSLRSIHYKGLDDSFLHVLTVTAATAGLLGAIFIAAKRRRPTLGAVKLGVFIGVYNAVALCVILIALSKLPGTVFFPVLGCSVVLLDNLFAHFYWREHLNRPAIAGVGVAILSLILVV